MSKVDRKLIQRNEKLAILEAKRKAIVDRSWKKIRNHEILERIDGKLKRKTTP